MEGNPQANCGTSAVTARAYEEYLRGVALESIVLVEVVGEYVASV